MNKVMLIGNVGVEPEIRYVDAGVELLIKLWFVGEVGAPPLVGATLCGRPLKWR